MMSRSSIVVAVLALFVTGSVQAGDKTYRDLLLDEGLARIISCELGGLAGKINRPVTIAPDMVKWSVEATAELKPHEETLPAAAQEFRKGYGAFLLELAKFSQEKSFSQEKTAAVLISPQVATSFRASSRTCGIIPCATGCCAPYCDPCKK